jgi:mono/diheme cytochrome c family protein
MPFPFWSSTAPVDVRASHLTVGRVRVDGSEIQALPNGGMSMTLIPSTMRTRLRAAARSSLLAIAAFFLTAGAALPAHAQARDSSSSAKASDSSWYKEYHPAAQDTLSPAAYNGWKLFELNCSRCHGDNAEGTSFAPSLVQALGRGGAVPTEQAFSQIVCNGIPSGGMPTWCKLGLTKDQIQTIYLYVKGRADGKIHPGRPTVRQTTTSSTQ